MRYGFTSVILCLAALGTLAELSALQEDPRALLDRAAEQTAVLRAEGAAPFQLEASIQYGDDGRQEAIYRLQWFSKEEYRSEFIDGEYSKTVVRTDGKSWLQQSHPGTPLHLELLQDAMHSVRRMVSKNEQLQFVRNSPDGMRCLRTRSQPPSAYCIHSETGLLARAEKPEWTFVYPEYQPMGGKVFPRRIQAGTAGRMLLNAVLTVAPLEGTVKSALITPPPGAEPGADCGPGPVQKGELLKSVPLAYPAAARQRGVTGVVVIYATIGKDGKVHAPSVLQSPGPEFDRAALDAIQQWTYRPYVLCGEPVEVQTRIRLNFTLGGR